MRPQSYHCDRPKIDKVLMHYVKEYARVRARKGRCESGMVEWRRRYGAGSEEPGR